MLHDDALGRSMINFRIRDFLVACAFIAVIGKQFQYSALSSTGPWTKYGERTVYGKHSNYRIIPIKLLFEAFTRAEIDIFT